MQRYPGSIRTHEVPGTSTTGFLPYRCFLVNEAIAEKLDINQLVFSSTSSKLFTIADLGCFVGPNTFIAVENIINYVKLKYQSFGSNQEALEFQVFFND
jgi:hypothetical protein